MTMIETIKGGMAAANAAANLIKGYFALKTEAEKNAAVVEIQRHVIDTQQGLATAYASNLEALQRINELEQEIVRFENWEAEKQRYEPAEAGPGCTAFRLKDGVEPPEPSHWICPHCYEQGKKSRLMMEKDLGRSTTLNCHPCGLMIVVSGRRPETAPRSSFSGRGR